MIKTRILASVSVAALMTAIGAGGARADNVVFDLSVVPPTLDAADKSASIVTHAQYGSVTNIVAENIDTVFGIPDVGINDYAGGTDSLLVDANASTADAFSNDAAATVDLFTADGTTKLDAATIAVLQVTSGATISTVDSTVDGTKVRIYAEDLGTGSVATITSNEISASATVNRSSGRIAGDINPGLAGGEIGQSAIVPGSMDSDATVLVSTAQILSDVDTPTALVVDSTVTLQATADGAETTELVNASLTVSGNLMSAAMTGNDAGGAIVFDDDKAISLPGSAGVANLQYAAGDSALQSFVAGSRIEIGADGAAVTADIDGGSATFTRNVMQSAVTANRADNAIDVPAGIDMDGPNAAADQINSVSSATDDSLMGADLFVHSYQNTVVDTYGQVSGPSNAILSVLLQDLTGATIQAGDTDPTNETDSGDFGNGVYASATGNAIDNTLDVKGATSFAATAGINSAQVAERDNASNLGGIILAVSVATSSSAGTVTDSGIVVGGNELASSATGNAQSSTLSIAGTDIAGAGVLPTGGASSAEVDRSTPFDGIAADFSVLSAQVLDAGNVPGAAGADANASTTITLEVVDQGGAVGTLVDDTGMAVSSNTLSSTAVGNLSTANGITIAAGASFSGTVGVINDQTVMNDAGVSANGVPGGGNGNRLLVEVAPRSLTNSSVDVDNNLFTARAWGNLATASSNAFTVGGVGVTDGDAASTLLPAASIGRTGDTVPVSTVDAGFALLNDQSAEDIEAELITANQSAPLVAVEIGSGATTAIDNTDVTISGNAGLTSAVVNQAGSRGTVTATDLDASSAVVNVQSFVDEDGDDLGGRLSANSNGTSMLFDVDTGDSDITQSDFALTGNAITVTGRINLANSELAVTAQTQTITGVALAGAEESVTLGADTAARGESMVVNDQFFDDLGQASTNFGNNLFNLDIDTGTGDLVSVEAEVSANTQLALLAGNEAGNVLTLNVDTYDLSDADATAGKNALNGPVGTVASNQRGIQNLQDTTAFSQVMGGSSVALNTSGVTGDISDTSLDVVGNDLMVWTHVNKATNTLKATGTSFETPTTSTPTASVLDATGGADVVLDQSGFAVASRQQNAYDVSSVSTGGSVQMTADGAATIVNSALKVDNNLWDTQGHGNDSFNTLTLDFTVNEAQGFVVNVQSSTDADPAIDVSRTGDGFILDANGAATMTATDSSFSVSDNKVQVLASANRTTNTLTSTGTNIIGGSGAAPGVTIDPAATGDIQVVADLAIVNAQGAATTAGTASDKITSQAIWGAYADVDTIDTGSLAVDNNKAYSESLIHSASNTLTIDASTKGANVTGVGASVTSQQVITDGSSVLATGQGNQIRALVDDVDGETLDKRGAAAISASGNEVRMLAIGGIAGNMLDVDADAGITGTVTTTLATLAAATDLAADFIVANNQLGAADSIAVALDGTAVLATVSGGDGLKTDSLSIENNLMLGQAFGFSATNDLILNAGASSDATGVLSSRQSIDSTSLSVSAFGTSYEATVNGAAGSSATVSDNAVLALTAANSAANTLESSAGATLQEESGAGVTVDPAGATAIAVTGSEYSILNWQSTEDGTSVRATLGATVGVDNLAGAVGVDDSQIAVEDNAALAQAVGNSAANTLVLNTGTFQHPSASIANLQTNSGTVIEATVVGAQIGIGLGGGNINANSTNSSLSVSGNSIGAVAIGSSSVSVIRAE